MVPKIYHFHNLPPIFPILQKDRTTGDCENGDLIETQTIMLYLCDMHNNMHITQSLSLPKFSSQLGPCKRVYMMHNFKKLKVVYRKKSFVSKESDTKILKSIYFACEVGIIRSYSNRILEDKVSST